MNFFIKQNSTFPILEFPMKQEMMEKYNITDEMMEDVAITFSMYSLDNGVYVIANKEANLKIANEDDLFELDETPFTLQYTFKERDTRTPGVFIGEYKIDFLGDNCGKITLPNDQTIQIIIGNSITKTTVIY